MWQVNIRDLQDLVDLIYEKAKAVLNTTIQDDTYAALFFVYSNEAYRHREVGNVTEISVQFVTEQDCDNAPLHSEDRWNMGPYSGVNDIITSDRNDGSSDSGMDALFSWYHRKGLGSIGEECGPVLDQDGNELSAMEPRGYIEVLVAAALAARQLQQEGSLTLLTHKTLPIIVVGMEDYPLSWLATVLANPGQEDKDYAIYIRKELIESRKGYSETKYTRYYDELLGYLDRIRSPQYLEGLIINTGYAVLDLSGIR